MVKLMTAKEAAELTKKGKQNFEQSVLEGERFKSIVKKIELSAEKGQNHYRINNIPDEELNESKMIVSTLLAAGYKAEIRPNLPVAGKPTTHSIAIVW